MRVLATLAAVVLAATPASAFEVLSHDNTENHWVSVCLGKKKPVYEFSHCSSLTRFQASNARSMSMLRAPGIIIGLHFYEPQMARIRFTFGAKEWRLARDGKYSVTVTFKDGHYTLKNCTFDGSYIGCQMSDPKLAFINDIAMKERFGLQVSDRGGTWDLGFFTLKGSLASITKTVEGVHKFYKDKPIRFGPPSQQHDG